MTAADVADPAGGRRLGPAVRAAAAHLAGAGVGSPRVDAELLAAHATGRSRSTLTAALLRGAALTPEQAAAFDALVGRRTAREPLQHLTGTAGFRRLDLAVGPGVFVPRPETELLAGWAIEVATGDGATVVDLCTGSGAIAAAVADEVPGARVLAVELDPPAHAWAVRNLARTGVELLLGDATTLDRDRPDLVGLVDVVVANPPYIPLGAWESVAPEVRDHDPALALWGGQDGLDVVRGVVACAARLLRAGGQLGVEHADAQGSAVPDLLAATGAWVAIRDHEDLSGRSRWTTARRAPGHANSTTGDTGCRALWEHAAVTTTHDCSSESGRAEGLDAAAEALGRGELVVIATDTVYGIAADAFDPDAVAALLAAKGRDRTSPPPVLIGAPAALDGLASAVPQAGRDLAAAFWPGALTLVCTEQPSLRWDLGDTFGTVALRMPNHPLVLDLLTRTGPLAVSSANRTGRPPAQTAAEARDQLGDAVAVYLESGPNTDPVPSSIVDVTGDRPVLLREGALSWSDLWRIAPDIVTPEQD